jgi:hypothetical protein
MGSLRDTFGALSLVLAAGLALTVSAARADDVRAEADDDTPSPWHFDLDVGYGRSEVRFVVPASYAGACDAVTALPPDTPPELIPAPPAACALPNATVDVMRGSIGLGHGGFTLEASLVLDRSVFDGSKSTAEPYLAWSAGVRLDTSWTSIFALTFRFAYVRRESTGLAGEGGRAGVGLIVRLAPWLVLYGEASIDATTVPSWMSDGGALLSYTSWLGGGTRFEFGH